MPPIPASKLTELALSRRKLFEKIVQHVASRKIQNHIQATGDRMNVTPQQFGMQVGKQMGKQALMMLPTMGIGAGLGALTAPTGRLSGTDASAVRAESVGRGATKGFGTGAGLTLGGLLATALTRGKLRIPPEALSAAGRAARRTGRKLPFPRGVKPGTLPWLWLEQKGLPRAGGALAGGGLGFAAADAALGTPSWEKKQASVLSVLGGLAGGGLGGLAGGAGGGILGALGGGALGGGPGAGLGLLAGGAAGLGAGAHMGGNIGASIGAGFSKKKEKSKSDEKEEKSEEKSEDSGDEEVKKSAAAVLEQLQKNAK